MNQWLTIIALSFLLTACATTGEAPLTRGKAIKASDINTELGAAYLGQGDYVRANAKLEKALKQNSQNAEAHNMYALLKMQLKQYDQANDSFSKALSLEPNNPSILNNYGAYLCDQGQIKDALGKFAKALKDPLYTTPEFAYTNTGICMVKQGNSSKAEAYFRTALKRNPKYTVALYQMALLNEKKQQYALAWDYMERFYKLGAPKNADNLWTSVRLSRILSKRNNEAKYSSLLKNRYPDSEQTVLMMRRYK